MGLVDVILPNIVYSFNVLIKSHSLVDWCRCLARAFFVGVCGCVRVVGVSGCVIDLM